MKQLIILFLFAMLSTAALATIRSVSNLDSSAQFSTIQAAIDASKNGDSIYVSRSPKAYSSFTINNKKLAIFGPGWSPYVPGVASVPGCILTGTGCSGSELHGLYFTNIVDIQTAGINNLLFYRNKIYGIEMNSNSVSNYIIEGNYFYSSGWIEGYASISNFTIRNNIFYNGGLYGLNGSNIVVNHNLWYASSSTSCFFSCTNLTVSNNIFDREDASGTSFSIFNNNITHNTANDVPWNSNNNNNAGGNKAGVSPQMADQASVDAARIIHCSTLLLHLVPPTTPAPMD